MTAWTNSDEENLMPRNVGTLDRLARIGLGVLILGLYGALDAPWRYITLLGLIPLGTGLTGRCLLYSMLGVSTRREPAEDGRPDTPGGSYSRR